MDHPERKRKTKPQLRRFLHHDKKIKLRELLGEGGEGVVYRVEIEGETYALKLFERWVYRGRKSLGLHEKNQIMTASFVHECRAFARLDSMGENGTWAVKCHGWMKLSHDQIKSLGLWKLRHEYDHWAIVKDYIAEELTLGHIPEIRRKMEIARKALLWPSDIGPPNYRGSFLVDLGRVRTYPYVRRLWSDTSRREWFAHFDKYGTSWDISVRDGSIIETSVNERLKEYIAEAAEMRKKRQEELNQRRKPDATTNEHISDKAM
ncbi:hypothetical protein FQN55_006471 [Onygenales sp. PD_40]|nr:hypothetical protein FQN55_006471 [Onygenales sp. PD_40]KAK2781671.1 hypothetical protein FQN53_000462 [Emmonsiellopsis sp. PD_33]KAK2787490.1 hypothetical protein FQN52_007208 [Onygenales sp. PD_12]KAK2798192.1 hypothetical protein FQN51_007878 [Onygenales sp. PD_10]